MNTAAKLSTGGKLSTAPFSASKKSGMKRENPPCTPYKRKARGKENNPGAISTGLSAGAYAGACERIRAREARRKREIGAAVEDALVAFCGTRRNPLFDLGRSAAAIRRCNPARTKVLQKRGAAATEKVRRKAPHLLPVFRLILKNGSNREKSICELIKIHTRKK